MSINKLPKKWCINGSKDLADWQYVDMKNCCSAYLDDKDCYYFLSDSTLYHWEKEYSKPNDYTVISFDEFLRYVVGKGFITGYRMKGEYKRYSNAAISIDGGTGFGTSIAYDQIIPIERTETIQRLKDAGILDIWFEPVLKECLELPVINGYKGEKISDTCVKYGCATFSIPILKNLVQFELLSGDRKIKSITLDSGVEITIEQIKEIVEYFK